MSRTVIVVADASSSFGLQYIAPYSATAIAEYFRNKGKDVLIVYDDLTKHAEACRSLSLLLKRHALFVVGRRLKAALDLKSIAVTVFHDAVMSVSGIQSALQEAVSEIMLLYEGKGYDNLPLVSVETAIPPDLGSVSGIGMFRDPPLTYLDPPVILAKALEEFLYITLYRCYLESLRSENWYRLKSMEGAAESIERRLGELAALQRYVRQEEITEEMLEIPASGMFYGGGLAR